MTHEELCRLVRRKQYEAGTLRRLCEQTGCNISTLSNMLGGRNRWTPRMLSLLGLDHVRVVEAPSRPTSPVEPAQTIRPYIPMWRLGDWPVF